MFLFQFLKHRLLPTAPQPGAAHTSGLVNWGWIFCPFGRGLVVSHRDMDSVVVGSYPTKSSRSKSSEFNLLKSYSDCFTDSSDSGFAGAFGGTGDDGGSFFSLL